MKVNYENNRDISFNGFFNNKALKKGLKFAAENGTLFAATTTLALSGIRPLAILATPKTDKRNKQIATTKSVISTLNGYLIALACSLPLAKSVKRIDKNPEKYLKKETINALKETGKKLTESKAYTFSTQLFKLGLGAIIAAPKAIITAIGIPIVVNVLDNETSKDKNQATATDTPTFKGKKDFSKKLGKIIDNKKMQKFTQKYKDSNFPMHIMATTDSIATLTFISQIKTSKNFEEKDKKPLIYNSIISTILSILSTYTIDRLTKKSTDNFITKFRSYNINDPNLAKYIEGIKIAKPILIAGLIYYIAIPVISTFLADRFSLKNKELFFKN